MADGAEQQRQRARRQLLRRLARQQLLRQQGRQLPTLPLERGNSAADAVDVTVAATAPCHSFRVDAAGAEVASAAPVAAR
jgi:hypothetical protein